MVELFNMISLILIPFHFNLNKKVGNAHLTFRTHPSSQILGKKSCFAGKKPFD